MMNCDVGTVEGFTLKNASIGSHGGGVRTNAPSPDFRNIIFRGNDAHPGGGSGGGLCIIDGNVIVENCVFDDNSAARGGALSSSTPGSVTLRNVTMLDNSAFVSAGGIHASHDTEVTGENVLMAFNNDAAAVCESGGSISLLCSDVFGNVGGNWDNCLAGQLGVNGNISLDPLFCGGPTLPGAYYVGTGSPCAPSYNPTCGLIGAYGVGCEGPGTGATEWEAARLSLLGNHPNPFGPATTISYVVPERAVLSLAVYDISGRLVRTLLDGVSVDAGRRQVVWDGRDGDGLCVSSGLYFCKLETAAGSSTQKLLLVR
jgi:hypothetical protein